MEYIGSKKRLLDKIEKFVCERVKINEDTIFCDLFAGTGVVSKHFKKFNCKIIANDIQYYSYVQLYCNLLILKQPVFKEFGGFENVIIYLNELKPIKGFIYKNYSPSGKNEYDRTFFTVENAQKIDAIRTKIEDLKENKQINLDEYFILLYCLLVAISKFSNTAVVFEAYLKQFKNSALREFKLTLPDDLDFKGCNARIMVENAIDLIPKLKGDVLYLDPPYNNRQYSRNFHLVETIMKYDEPTIKGKAGIRVDSFLSSFSRKTSALEDMELIIKNSNFKFIVISYNNEGIIKKEEFLEMLNKYGKVDIKEINYTRFKSNDRTNSSNGVKEFLISLEKE